VTAVAIATHRETLAERQTDGLLEAARAGERGAFDELYRRHAPAVARRIAHLLGPRHSSSVHDLVQETFVQAYRSLGQLRGGEAGSFAGWVLRIATNLARGHYRQGQRRPWRLWRRPEEEQSVPSCAEAVDQSYPTVQAVHRGLEELSPKLREALILFELEGLSLVEMAAALEIPLHTAASRVRRGREDLRRALVRLGWQPRAGLPDESAAALCGSELR
jgi:RNA polymerase sigma-70 factor (ECF subfamily)